MKRLRSATRPFAATLGACLMTVAADHSVLIAGEGTARHNAVVRTRAKIT